MRLVCRLCDNSAAAGSMFCEAHRLQAAKFADSFGLPQDQNAKIDEKKIVPQVPVSSLTQETSEADDTLEHESTNIFIRNFLKDIGLALEKIRDRWLTNQDYAVGRWPQLSVYFLDNKLMVRTYYCIVCNMQDDPVSNQYSFSDQNLIEAFSSRSVLGKYLGQLFDVNREALQSQHIQTMDIQLRHHQALVIVNLHYTQTKEKTIATFRYSQGQFDPVDPQEINQKLE